MLVSMAEVVVLGAGPAGLAVAGALRLEGVASTVIDRATSIGSSWRGHYDRLHLHTTRRLSALPGRPIPAEHGTWVARDAFIDYLEEYARSMRLDVRLGVTATRIDRAEDEGWRVETSEGVLEAAAVVVATGYNHTPKLPDWPGRDRFEGRLLHSAEYRNPEPFRGQDVLVVGSGNSGAEIAADLVEGGARGVWISIRTPPNIVRRNVAGPIANQHLGIVMNALPAGLVDPLSLLVQRAAIGDLAPYGLAAPDVGVKTRIVRDEQIPLIDVGFLDHLRAGRIAVVPGVDGLDRQWVRCGNVSVRAEAVIAATGYERGLEGLVGHLGVLNAGGRPGVHAPQTPSEARGLYFVGYRNPMTGNLYDVARTAQRLADRLRDRSLAIR